MKAIPKAAAGGRLRVQSGQRKGGLNFNTPGGHVEDIAQQQYCDHAGSRSIVLHASSRAARIFYRLGLLLAMASSAPAYAILSCQAGAGPTVSGGAFDECMPIGGKFAATADSPYGSASVSAPTGSMSGNVTVSPSTIGDGRFFSELVVDFRISGPTPGIGGSVPIHFIFSTHGEISGDCTNCEADVGGSYQIDSVSFSGFQMRTSAVRTRTTDWLVTSSEFDNSGLGLGPTHSVSTVNDTTAGSLSFDAASALGHTFRLTANLSGNAHLTGPNAPNAFLTVDGSHTALFNILVPEGYTLSTQPANFPFLTSPLLVPEPSTYALMMVGLGLVGVAAQRHRRT